METCCLNIGFDGYYPFGQIQPGRSFTSSSYRYGFNGHEKEGTDWTGNDGSHLDFGARIYDSRLGKFLSIDPWTSKYAWQTPYAYFRNSPIWKIDFMGLGDKESSTKETQIIASYIPDKYDNGKNKEIGTDIITEQTITNTKTTHQDGSTTFEKILTTTTAIINEKAELTLTSTMERSSTTIGQDGSLISQTTPTITETNQSGSEKFNAIVTGWKEAKSNTYRSPLFLFNKNVEFDMIGDATGGASAVSYILKKSFKKVFKPKHPVMKILDGVSIVGSFAFLTAKALGFAELDTYTYQFDYSLEKTEKEYPTNFK